MAPYQYAPLRNASQEIRLVHLLPGKFEDNTKVQILHSPFPLPTTPSLKAKNFQIDSIQAFFSRPWTIEETENGDFVIFNIVTSEAHPLPTVVPSPDKISECQPRYKALSYSWGDASISEFGHVETDQGCDGPSAMLGLRPNLASALRYLRYSDETRVLWIDAICINQEDIEKRNEHVKRMTNIYKLAPRVIAWLGEESDNSKHALATLKHLGQQLKTTKSGRIIAAPGATEPQAWRNDHALSFNQRTWQALINFVERAWFYRLWCWQEIKLGSRHAFLQCGGDVILWNIFWLAVLYLHNKDSLPLIRFRERCRHIVFLKYDDAGHSMSNIVDISQSKNYIIPRDKVYRNTSECNKAVRAAETLCHSRPSN